MLAVAWDIETCPLPSDGFTSPQEERHQKEVETQQERNPGVGHEEASKRARSFHPYLGWISCISVVRGKVGEGMAEPRSWSAGAPGEEASLLKEFWEAVGKLNARPRWATYNGKEFDVPFLTARSSYHGISPTRQDIIETYPFSHDPHVDLSKVWLSVGSSFEEMCDHLGVPSPKEDGMDGSVVAEAVSDGRLDKVEAYCERDVVATFRCLSSLQWAL